MKNIRWTDQFHVKCKLKGWMLSHQWKSSIHRECRSRENRRLGIKFDLNKALNESSLKFCTSISGLFDIFYSFACLISNYHIFSKHQPLPWTWREVPTRAGKRFKNRIWLCQSQFKLYEKCTTWFRGLSLEFNARWKSQKNNWVSFKQSFWSYHNNFLRRAYISLSNISETFNTKFPKTSSLKNSCQI